MESNPIRVPRDLVDCGRQAGAGPLALARRCGWILRSFQPAELRRALQGLEATCLRAVCVEAFPGGPVGVARCALWWPPPAWRERHAAAARPSQVSAQATAQRFPLRAINGGNDFRS